MPRPVRHHQANLPMTVTEVTETENFQSHILCSMIAETEQIGGRCHMRIDNDRVHTRGNFTRRPLSTVANFCGV